MILPALDPANRGFDKNLTIHDRYVNEEDAEYVDVIHTSSGSGKKMLHTISASFGFKYNIGHVDYFPNGGKHQPHLDVCTGFGSRIWCGHSASMHYFYASLDARNQFNSINCRNYDEFKKFLDDKGSMRCDASNYGRMGYFSINTKATGKQYLKMDKHYPYIDAHSNNYLSKFINNPKI